MSTTKLTYVNTINGVIQDAVSVTASDATATYGVQRKDNGSNVVAPGTAFTRVALGTYELEFTDPAPDLIYRYHVRVETDLEIVYAEKESSLTPAVAYSYAGRYASYAGMVTKFGKISIIKWASTDSADDTAIRAAIVAAVDKADAYVDGYLLNSVYTIPFESATCPLLIRDIADTFAALFLYESQGTMDFDEESGQPQHKLKIQKREAMKDLSRIARGSLCLLDTDGNELGPDTLGPAVGPADASTATASDLGL